MPTSHKIKKAIADEQKRKQQEADAAVLKEAIKVVEESPKPEIDEAACGHINKQYFNLKGELEDLPCVLTKGHKGDHEASYPKLVNGQLVNGTANWTDAAGTPAKKHG